MIKNKTILLCGFPCSGKDTVGTILENQFGYKRIAFGNNLKILCSYIRLGDVMNVMSFMVNAVGLSGEAAFQAYKRYRDIPCNDKKDRLLLQTVGTEMRKIKNDVWVNPVKHFADKNKCVITDCRRLFELESFPKAYKVFIDVPDHIIYKRLKERDGYYDIDILTKESEIEIPSLKEKCDFVIDNDGSLRQLVKRVQAMMMEEQ